MRPVRDLCILVGALLLSCCAPRSGRPVSFPTYDPFVSLQGDPGNALAGSAESSAPVGPATPSGPTPTRAPISVRLPSTSTSLNSSSPTPDSPHAVATIRAAPAQHFVQPGETLGMIARQYGLSLAQLQSANGITDPNILDVGMLLVVPPPDPTGVGPSRKIIPDSELVYGPASAIFDTRDFVWARGGYLAAYMEEVGDEVLRGDEIVTRIARNYSVNPRLLLAIIEHSSGWLTEASARPMDYPLGWQDPYRMGLYLQLGWAADTLNRGYYLWKANAISAWVLADGTAVPIEPTINAGTAALQHYFAQLHPRDAWEAQLQPTGFSKTYEELFGDPFDLAVEPLVPAGLRPPDLQLPFEFGDTWSFTGGPHGGWDTGSAWAALDFGPPGDTASCAASTTWIAAIADGLVIRSEHGAVLQDLDNDGFEGTGWVVLYMHVDSGERVRAGTYLYGGQRVGHASCEGGLSNGTHVHIARRYNGEWIPADGVLPFTLDGWVSGGNGIEYDGWLRRGGQVVEAWDGVNPANQIGR